MLTLTQTRNTIEPTLQRWAVEMRKDAATAVREAARRVTRQVIALTPPASAGLTGRDAYNQGRAKIRRDLLSVLAPRTLKGKRKERWPDVAVTYRARRVFRQSGVGVRITRGPVAFVDRRKFLDLQNRKHAAVGRMAAGWLPGARALDVPVLQWIARHGGARGGVSVAWSVGRFGIRVANYAPGAPANVRAEMARRIPYALRYVERGLRANIDHVALKSAARSGIRVLRQPTARAA